MSPRKGLSGLYPRTLKFRDRISTAPFELPLEHSKIEPNRLVLRISGRREGRLFLSCAGAPGSAEGRLADHAPPEAKSRPWAASHFKGQLASAASRRGNSVA
jgi:hypothetical protein